MTLVFEQHLNISAYIPFFLHTLWQSLSFCFPQRWSSPGRTGLSLGYQSPLLSGWAIWKVYHLISSFRFSASILVAIALNSAGASHRVGRVVVWSGFVWCPKETSNGCLNGWWLWLSYVLCRFQWLSCLQRECLHSHVNWFWYLITSVRLACNIGFAQRLVVWCSLGLSFMLYMHLFRNSVFWEEQASTSGLTCDKTRSYLHIFQGVTLTREKILNFADKLSS